jgi:V/A-type H+/Na+-transporting ATPase subunit I
MRLPEPVQMSRIAIVAPKERLRSVLRAVADFGIVEPEIVGEREEHLRELSNEAAFEALEGSAVIRGSIAAIAGWIPSAAYEALSNHVRPLGASVVHLATPRGSEPPTLLPDNGAGSAFQPLVDVYATVPYADVNPALFAGLAYVIMFGMMFGDVGHGLILLFAGLMLARGRPRALQHLRRAAPFVIGAGVASCGFGFAYGEAFGPTKLVPTLWLSPLAQPLNLLAASIGVGAFFLAISYVLGTANRWREGGAAQALTALSGVAGSALYVGLALLGWGWYRQIPTVLYVGLVIALAGMAFGYVGLLLESGGRSAGALEAGVELFDAVIRLGTNAISFARLAAFGLTHAALESVIWSGTLLLADRGPAWWVCAAALFLVGNAVAFSLEALVAGIQALRLDYYELFSRVFISVGRPFRPWHIPLQT